MKALNLTTVKKIGLVLFTALFLTTSINAANPKTGGNQLNKSSRLNIVEGIKSSNNGVKRDCIYYAAIYEIKEAVDVLKTQLENEKDPRTCVLLSLALSRLGETNGVKEIYGESLTDWNKRVQFMSNEIVNLYKNQENAVASYNGD